MSVAPALPTTIPCSPLPDITLRSRELSPPIVLLLEFVDNSIPSSELPRSDAPSALVPIKLPDTTLLSELSRETPSFPLPDTTLRASAVFPPIVLFVALVPKDTPD